MSLILKAEFNGEIRRVGLSKDDDATVERLEAKLRTLFPQLGDSFLMTCSGGDFHNDTDVAQAFVEAAGKKPPLVRISVDPTQARRQVVSAPADAEYVQIPSPAEPEPAFEESWTSISQALGHKCRLCDVTLEGVHYKCLNCLDVEICSQCEEAQLHDPSHLFVKMRCHVDSLPLKRQLIFKSHIDNPNEREMAKEEKKKLREMKIEIDNRKKEAREAERKKKAQEKLKRLQARKEIVSNKKAKLTAAEKKKKAAISKVKRAKKVMAVAPVVETVSDEVVCAGFVEVPKEESPQEKDFSFLRFISEFHLLKEAPKQDEQEQKEEQEEEEKVEIELQEIREEQKEEVVVLPVEQEEEVKSEEKKESAFAKNLKVLEEMGFTDREKNIELLARNVGNLDETINQLLHPTPFAALSRWLPFAIGL
jgi:hypothetical protein